MKKILLTFFALATIGANAQFAPGSTAPDFTATDIYGNSHSLYTDYLNEGKHVLLNVSATWCGPCWNYHNTHALGEFYEAYGPNGSNEAVVLYVEGDPSTTLNDIYGTGNNTWGNWTTETPYPIIDSGTVANLYHAPYAQPYFPTIFRICSTGILTEINQLTAPNLRNNFSNNCSTLIGVPNHVKVLSSNIYACHENGGSATFKVKNYGNNNITEAVLVLKESGNIVATQTFTGNVAQFGTANVNFQSLDLISGGDYTIEVQSINGGTIHNADFAVAEIGEVTIAEEVEYTTLEVKVYTDSYPGEARWRIKNSAGTIIASAGPYQGNGNNAGGVDANTTKTHNISVVANECYTVELLDQYGDGWGLPSSSNPNTPGLEIFENGTSVIFINGTGAFSNTAPLSRLGAFKTAGVLDSEDFNLNKFSVYPNPSTGIFNIFTSEIVKVNIIDISGKTVYKADALNNNAVINLSSLQSGIYLMNVSGENINKTEKLIIK